MPIQVTIQLTHQNVPCLSFGKVPDFDTYSLEAFFKKMKSARAFCVLHPPHKPTPKLNSVEYCHTALYSGT